MLDFIDRLHQVFVEDPIFALGVFGVFWLILVVIFFRFLSRVTYFYHRKKILNLKRLPRRSTAGKIQKIEHASTSNFLKKIFLVGGYPLLWGAKIYIVFLGILFLGAFLEIVSWFSGLLFFLLGGGLWVLIGWRYQKKEAQKIEQFPLFLQALARSLQAGYTVDLALDFVGGETTEPLRGEVKHIMMDLQLGRSISDAFKNLADRLEHPDVRFLAQSLDIQLQSGANLVALFSKIATHIEEKLKLERDIRSFTSQGKMSGYIVAGLWPLSFLIFWQFSPDHIAVLFDTGMGNFLLLISILFEILGFYMISKLMKIDF
jgi:Flp pilus assembly protein TadB